MFLDGVGIGHRGQVVRQEAGEAGIAAIAALQLGIQLSDFHARPDALASDRLGHLGSQHEVRVACDIDLARVTIASLSH